MKHWQPDRPARPAPMERWIFLLMVVFVGIFIGYALYAMLDGRQEIATICAAGMAAEIAYMWVRIRESGWP